jgi:cell cycle arrest protein BUB3
MVVDNDYAVPESKAVEDPPTDGITGLQYISSSTGASPLLASTSWDGQFRLHQTYGTRSCVLRQDMKAGPLLSLAVLGRSSVVTGGCDGFIRRLDIETSKETMIGMHTAANDEDTNKEGASVACSCLSAADEHVIVSAGWDKQLHVWDNRLKTSSGASIATLNLPGKAFAMDLNQNLIAVATSGRRTCLLDLRLGSGGNSTDPATVSLLADRESSLKYQTRSLQFFSDGRALVIGSIEGRAAVEYFEEETGRSARGKKPFAFKCHRVGDRVYPVNAIACHPVYATTFATGGCDGTVVLWDAEQKKKITALPAFPTSVAAMAFHPEGTELAVASSYTFEEGEREQVVKDEIYIRPLLPSEYMPKSSS